MNTLPRAVTAQWFESEDAYWTLRRHWRGLLCSERKHTLGAAHHLLYRALLGKDWRRAFTPPRNLRKLANGGFAHWALFGALARIRFEYHADEVLAPFDGLVTSAMLAALRPRLPQPTPNDCAPEEFTGGAWPFDAYPLPAAEPVPHD